MITAAAVAGSAIGIRAVSSGTGNISVRATGAVTGTGTAGVQATGGATTGTVTINVATVTGKTGIEAKQGSANALNVNATGTVTGTGAGGIGIDALASSAGALTITAAAVTGSAHGIKAIGSGAGAVSVKATGEVKGTGASGQGVFARATAAANLSVNVATVTGSAVGIKAVGSGSGDVTVNAGTVMATGASGIGIDASAAGGDVTISAAAVTGVATGVKVAATGAGSVSISATGAVTGTGTAGVQATGGATTGSVTINVATVTGKTGIDAEQGSANALNITATGAVTGTGASGAGIDALVSSAGALSITAAAVTGSAVGIKAISSGAGAVSVRASGAVLATGAGGIGVQAQTSGGALTISAATVTGTATGIKVAAFGTGSVSISASGTVTGTGSDGIFVDHDGSGATTITVTTAVTGGTGANVAAIRTDAQSNSTVTILLNSGASVGTTTAGTANAIIGGAGNTAVTVNSNASIAGKVKLGDGTDTLTFAGGTFSNVTEFDGGADSDDKLTFSKGGTQSLHTTVVSEGLKGWESVVVESGVTISGGITLAADSEKLTLDNTDIAEITALSGGAGTANILELNDVDGALNGANVTGWETISVAADSSISFGTGAHGLTVGTLNVAGTLNLGDASDTSDMLTVTGSFAGGGRVTLNANFLPNTNATDKLIITGNVTGTTSLVFTKLAGNLGSNETDLDRPLRITDVVEVRGNTVSASAFTATGNVAFGAVAYRLEFNATAKRFDLVRYFTNKCESAGSGAWTCSGANQIGVSESLSASDATALSVTLFSQTPVGTDRTAFVLTQTGGIGGISFTQSANGQSVSGANSAIVARNTGGGAVSINVNGQVTGVSGDGISASDGAGGGGVTIVAASVSGSDSGIEALGSGTGAVAVRATGTVTGASEEGIYAKAGASGSTVTVTAAAVTGGKVGIKAVGGNARNVLINASGAVSATGAATGTGIDGLVSANGNLMITAAAVTGSAIGIKAVSSGSGNISVRATGAVTGTGTAGVQATGGNATGALTINAATVTGKTGIEAKQGSANALDIAATGTVTGTGAGGIGIDALASSAGALTITAAAVTGSAVGIRAVSSGAGAVTVNAGTVMATGAGGTGIDASASGGNVTISAAAVTGTATGIKVAATGAGRVSIAASGAVTGTGSDGIFVDHDGAGATTITVTTAVTGGSGNNNAAIRTDVSTGGATILLNSGATVGTTAQSRGAIKGGAGNSAVTVNTGASIAGKVSLGAGSDTLTFVGGTFSNVTEFDGGAGNDTLTFRSGSGALDSAVQTQGLKGWESVVVESGATISGTIKLDDSGNLTLNNTSIAGITALTGGSGNNNTLALNNVSGSFAAGEDWEAINVGAGSSITLGAGSHSLEVGTLSVAGTLNVGGDTDTDDHLTVSGDFAGGGTVIINAENFTADNHDSDKLTITGNLSGVTSVNIVPLGILPTNETTITPFRTISGVITVQGTVAAGARFTGGIGFGAIGYQLVRRENTKIFDLKPGFTNKCEGGSGVFTCSGANPIGSEQALGATGSTPLQVTLNSETPVAGVGTAFALTQSGGRADLTFTQSANGKTIRAAGDAIQASNLGGGAISISVNGTVTASAGDGIRATNDASGAGIAITAATVSGSDDGIEARGSGSGSVSISASGTVTGGDAGIYASTSSGGGGIAITAAAVTGGSVGIKVAGSGSGAVSVRATGAVTGTGTAGIEVAVGTQAAGVSVSAAAVTGSTGIKASHAGTGALNISASGDVTGTAGDGIFVDRDRSGVTNITVSAKVIGSNGTNAAIRTDVQAGSAVNMSLDSGASVGTTNSPKAIIGGSGNTIVTANSGAAIIGAVELGAGSDRLTVNTGASISGAIKLGGGADTLTFAGGAFSGVTEMDGGAGDGDTLTFNGGSGALSSNVQSQGLKGWESVVVNSAAAITGGIKLADNSKDLTLNGVDLSSVGTLTGGGGSDNILTLNDISGTLASASAPGWETISIGADSRIKLGAGAHRIASGVRVADGGTLDVGRDADTTDRLTIEGDFTGSGGTIALNANFTGSGATDTLTISGNLSGAAVLNIGKIAETQVGERPQTIEGVITVTGNVSSSAAFTVAGDVIFGGIGYRLEFVEAAKRFDLTQYFTNKCETGGDGAFTCSGTRIVGGEQTITAGGTATLSVVLNSETTVRVDGGDAFTLTQTGSAGIVFTQAAGGNPIHAAGTAFKVRNANGGSVRISVGAAITANAGDGITVSNDASGAGVAVEVGSVTAGSGGIMVRNGGSGGVSVVASGAISGTSGAGIDVSAARGGADVNVTAGSVSGGTHGIAAAHGGGGAVSIRATGAVVGTTGDGVRASAGPGGTRLTVSAGTVTGGASGIRATQEGRGALSITASGDVTGRGGASGDAGLYAKTQGSALTVTLNDSASVSGASRGIDLLNTGSGDTNVDVAGSVRGGVAEGVRVVNRTGSGAMRINIAGEITGGAEGVHATSSGAGEVRIAVATVRGSSGIKVENSGGAVSVAASGAITATGSDGDGIAVLNSGDGSVTIRARGEVSSGRGHGIRARNDGSGDMTIEVSETVQGGAVAGKAAISSDGGSGATRIVLESGANVRAGGAGGAAILADGGSVDITARTGSSITGNVRLGSGSDRLVFAGGDFGNLTGLDGGTGNDTLRFTGGGGSFDSSVGGAGIVGFESVIVTGSAALRGDVTLGAGSGELVFDDVEIGGLGVLTGTSGDSTRLAFRNVAGSVDPGRLRGWKTLEIGEGANVTLIGNSLESSEAQALSVTGTMSFGNSRVDNAFTVETDFSGGGRVAIDADLESGKADRLVITGDAVGTTAIVLRAGGKLKGSGESVDVVTVEGDADASAFSIEGDVVTHGAFIYDIGFVADGSDKKFVLQPGSKVSDTGAVLKSAPAAIATGFARATSLAARTAARAPSAVVGAGIGSAATLDERGDALVGQSAVNMASAPSRAVWMRFIRDKQEFGATEISGKTEFSSDGFQLGLDVFSSETAGGKWIGGLTAQYGSVTAEANGGGGVGKQESEGYGLGATLSWLGYGGFYTDSQAQFGAVDTDYSSDTASVIKKGVAASTALAGVEIGWRIAAGDMATFVPQGQISWSSVSGKSFTSDDETLEVNHGTSSTAHARLGLAAEFALPRGGIRFSGSVLRRLSDPSDLTVNGKSVAQELPDGWAEFGLGGSLDVTDSLVFFLDGTWRSGLGDNGDEATGSSVSGGLKLSW